MKHFVIFWLVNLDILHSGKNFFHLHRPEYVIYMEGTTTTETKWQESLDAKLT